MASPICAREFDAGSFLDQLTSEKTTSTRYRKSEVIVSQGDPSDSMFYIEHGTVKFTLLSERGKEAIVSVASGGTFFGESCISQDRPVRFHSAVALTNVRLVRIDGALVRRLLRAGGETALKFVSLIFRRNAEIQEDLATRLVESSEESLDRIISSLTEFKSKRDGDLSPKISQQTLAEMLGISRQHVNVLMKRLAKARLAPEISTAKRPECRDNSQS
jgi:CRP/FNR family cyclic AMP-dependent transcriptional regulator